MRIAIISPLYETVPPKYYGGTERVIHWLVEDLVKLGHDVTLYAASGSRTTAKLVECTSASLRELGLNQEACQTAHIEQLGMVFSHQKCYDVIHVHHDSQEYHAALLQDLAQVPVVWTDHGGLDNERKAAIVNSLCALGIGFTALSDSQRRSRPELRWLATIHHGLPAKLLRQVHSKPSEHLGFLGRISPEKGIADAVEIASRTGLALEVAAKVDNADAAYYENQIAPLFAERKVRFIGEIGDEQKPSFLSQALALLFPICWEEPFGIVMIEAMACGCPVVAFRRGSVPEIIEDGVTGFIVDSVSEAVQKLSKLGQLDRGQIRQRFQERFTSGLMSAKYIEVYNGLTESVQD